MKKNLGAQLALYPSPVVVVGAMVDGKPNWTLVAHAGIMAHSHLMLSMVKAHYTNKGIRENKVVSVNVVDASWLKEADRARRADDRQGQGHDGVRSGRHL